MTVDEISRYAANGKKPDGMNMHEELLFYRLRDIYAAAKAGRIATKQGADMKKMEVLYFQGKMEQEKRVNKILAQYAGAEVKKNDSE